MSNDEPFVQRPESDRVKQAALQHALRTASSRSALQNLLSSLDGQCRAVRRVGGKPVAVKVSKSAYQILSAAAALPEGSRLTHVDTIMYGIIEVQEDDTAFSPDIDVIAELLPEPERSALMKSLAEDERLAAIYAKPRRDWTDEEFSFATAKGLELPMQATPEELAEMGYADYKPDTSELDRLREG